MSGHSVRSPRSLSPPSIAAESSRLHAKRSTRESTEGRRLSHQWFAAPSSTHMLSSSNNNHNINGCCTNRGDSFQNIVMNTVSSSKAKKGPQLQQKPSSRRSESLSSRLPHTTPRVSVVVGDEYSNNTHSSSNCWLCGRYTPEGPGSWPGAPPFMFGSAPGRTTGGISALTLCSLCAAAIHNSPIDHTSDVVLLLSRHTATSRQRTPTFISAIREYALLLATLTEKVSSAARRFAAVAQAQQLLHSSSVDGGGVSPCRGCDEEKAVPFLNPQTATLWSAAPSMQMKIRRALLLALDEILQRDPAQSCGGAEASTRSSSSRMGGSHHVPAAFSRLRQSERHVLLEEMAFVERQATRMAAYAHTLHHHDRSSSSAGEEGTMLEEAMPVPVPVPVAVGPLSSRGGDAQAVPRGIQSLERVIAQTMWSTLGDGSQPPHATAETTFPPDPDNILINHFAGGHITKNNNNNGNATQHGHPCINNSDASTIPPPCSHDAAQKLRDVCQQLEAEVKRREAAEAALLASHEKIRSLEKITNSLTETALTNSLSFTTVTAMREGHLLLHAVTEYMTRYSLRKDMFFAESVAAVVRGTQRVVVPMAFLDNKSGFNSSQDGHHESDGSELEPAAASLSDTCQEGSSGGGGGGQKKRFVFPLTVDLAPLPQPRDVLTANQQLQQL